MGPYVIKINDTLFTENSAKLQTSINALIADKFAFSDANGVLGADTYCSPVLDAYKQAAVELSKAVEQYKQLLEKDYATLQAVADRIRNADTQGTTGGGVGK